jgi:hypothetical protein
LVGLLFIGGIVTVRPYLSGAQSTQLDNPALNATRPVLPLCDIGDRSAGNAELFGNGHQCVSSFPKPSLKAFVTAFNVIAGSGEHIASHAKAD